MSADDHISREDQILARVFELISKGGRPQINQAVMLLDKELTNRVTRYFLRHRIPPEVAEELTNDLWLKLVTSRFDGRTRPVVWMWKIGRSLMIDWIRHEAAEKRGRAAQGDLDDDKWLELMESVPSLSMPGWIRLCIERAIWQLEQDDPARAEVLRMVFEGWTDVEIAIYYGADPDTLSKKQQTAARDRVYRARKRAQEYFADCKD